MKERIGAGIILAGLILYTIFVVGALLTACDSFQEFDLDCTHHEDIA